MVSSTATWVPDEAASPLQSHRHYQWCIQYRLTSGSISDWACGVFRTAVVGGLGSGAQWVADSGAVWIGSADELRPLNELRRDLDLQAFARPDARLLARMSQGELANLPAFPMLAVVSVSGLGYYLLFVNGQRVDPTRQLDPTWTAYEHRIHYSSFDITHLLQPGGNALGILLGGGWFNRGMHFAWQLPKPNYGPPRAILSLNVTWSNGSSTLIVSDRSWQGRAGAVLMDHVYHGEYTDGRLLRPGWANFSLVDNRSHWDAVDELASPGGQLQLMPLEPIRSGPDNLHVKLSPFFHQQPPGVIGAPVVLHDGLIHTANVSQPIRSVYIFDLGQNFAGCIRIFMKGSPGWPVVIRYGEALLSLPAGSSTHVFQASFRGATQSDTYLLRGDAEGEWYEPKFTYHGFRYVSVFRPYAEGLSAAQVVGVPLHTETSLVGQFVSSSRILNQIQHNIQWGMLSQAMGIFTDCPSRDERMGWMDDLLLTSDQGLYNFDLTRLYSAFLDQMDDGQNANGNYYDTTPVMLDEDSDPNWSSAPIILAWTVYKHTTDRRVLSQHYDNHLRLVEYWYGLYNRTGLLHMPGTYGDWSPPAPHQPIDPALPSAFIFMVDVLTLINISRVLNYSVEERLYTRLYYRQLAPEFHTVFYGNVSGCYYPPQCPQPAQVLALDLPEVVPPELRSAVLGVLVKSIASVGYFTGGETSYARLWYVLTDNGYTDLALSLAQSTSYPSLGYQFVNDFGVYATTLWEIFNAYEGGVVGMNSLNHVMFSTIGQWFYERLAGIEATPDSAQPIIIHPRLPTQHALLPFVRAEHASVYGLVGVNWTLVSPLVQPHDATAATTCEWCLLLSVSLPPNISPVPVTFDPLSPYGHYDVIVEAVDGVVWGEDPSAHAPAAAPAGAPPSSASPGSRSVRLLLTSGQYDFEARWTPGTAPASHA